MVEIRVMLPVLQPKDAKALHGGNVGVSGMRT